MLHHRVHRHDLDPLVRLTDEYKPWLSSLNVVFTAGGFMLTSQGPFRRPFRRTGDETLALALGLATARGGQKLAGKLGALLAKSPAVARATATIGLGPTPGEHDLPVRRRVRGRLCGRGRP